MKPFNYKILLLTILLIAIGCSTLSVSSSAENLRYTLASLNPWNGIEGVAFTIGYILHTSAAISYLLTFLVLMLIGWGIYTLLHLLVKHLVRK